MIQMPSALPWLDDAPSVGGFPHVSDPRRYAHDEAAYDVQYPNEADRPEVGRGVVTIARAFGGDLAGAALEVGCGTGLLSVGLAAAQAYPAVVLTDPSPAFLDITRRKIDRAGMQDARVRYAVLMAEDLARVPDGALSLVVLRSALHHVLEWERFVADAARALRPGGILAFQEPCAEGYLLMGAMAQFLPLAVESAGGPLARLRRRGLTRRQREQVQLFVDTMRFGVRRDVDKSQAEDKHEFRVDEVIKAGRRVGLEVDFLPNTVFEDCADAIPPPRRETSFFTFFRDYLKYCMSFDAELVGLFEQRFEPYCRMIDELSRNGDGPSMHGVFVGRKARP